MDAWGFHPSVCVQDTLAMPTIESLSALDDTTHANVFPTAEPKTIRLSLSAGEEVEPHAHPGRSIVMYVIEGALELRLDDEVYELSAREIAHFDGDQEISPRAIEESQALILLARRD